MATELPDEEVTAPSPQENRDDASQISTHDSSVARCPPEVWLNILCLTGTEHGYDAYEAMGWGHSAHQTVTDEIFPSWYRGKDVPWNTGREMLGDWKLRLVCKAWNVLLGPFLFRSLWILASPAKLQQAIELLHTGTDDRPVGNFVRSVFFQTLGLGRSVVGPDGESVLPGEEPSTSSLVRKILDLCPRVGRIMCHADLALTVNCLPTSTSGIRQLFLQNMGRVGNALLDFITTLSALEVLDLGNTSFPELASARVEGEEGKELPVLHSLALRLDIHNISFLHLLASFRLPALRDLMVRTASGHDAMTSLGVFLRVHGPALKGIIFLHHAYDTQRDGEQELELLTLCPNLEEYVTRVPISDQTLHHDLPWLRYLRQIGVLGMSPSDTEDLGLAREEDQGTIAFATKLAEADLPSLRVVKSLHGEHAPVDGFGTTWTAFEEKITRIFEPRGIRFDGGVGAKSVDDSST